MDNRKFGQFILKLRKEKGWTQLELAEKLNVTDKAVSKWERGVGFPDIKMVEPLAEVLDVSVFEIMRSERIPDQSVPMENAAEAINNVALPAGVPIIAGESGIMSGCGIATLSIDYYELGVTTGEMAVRILNGEEKVNEMPIEYYQNPVKKYDAERCEALGITIPDGYEAA